jgi:transcriptional regulator with XRE-family HTH domain
MNQSKSQLEVGKKAGIPPNVYSLIETGRLKPSKTQIKNLEDYFDEPIESLLKEIEVCSKNFIKKAEVERM